MAHNQVTQTHGLSPKGLCPFSRRVPASGAILFISGTGERHLVDMIPSKGFGSEEKITTYCGWTKSVPTTLKPWLKPLFVGIYVGESTHSFGFRSVVRDSRISISTISTLGTSRFMLQSELRLVAGDPDFGFPVLDLFVSKPTATAPMWILPMVSVGVPVNQEEKGAEPQNARIA